MNIKTRHFKDITLLAWPLMLGSVLQILMGTVDMLFISRLGTEFAAASSMGNSISGVVFIFSMLVSSGAMAIIARKKGEKDYNAITEVTGSAITLSIGLGLIISIITKYFIVEIIRIYGADDLIEKIINNYLSIIFTFTFVVFLNTTLRIIVQSLGDTFKPLIIFGTANIINILLDYILIIKLNLGIQGAAIATVTSQSVACLMMIALIMKKIYKGSISSFLLNLKVKYKEVLVILKIGIWSCIQSIARPVTGLIMMRIVYEAGAENGSAAFGIGLVIINYVFIVLVGLSSAISIMVGHKIGENNIIEAKEIVNEGILYSMINIIVFSIPIMIFTKYLFMPFKVSQEVVNIGIDYLRILYIGFTVISYTMIYRGAFAGAGDTFPPMIASLIANVVCKLSFALIATKLFKLGINGVWYAILLSIFVEALIMILYYRKGRLYKNKLRIN